PAAPVSASAPSCTQAGQPVVRVAMNFVLAAASQGSSRNGFVERAASAAFTWQVTIACVSLATAFATASSHVPVGLSAGKKPRSSSVLVVVVEQSVSVVTASG